MPGTYGVQDAIGEGERGKGEGAAHGMLGLETLDARGEHALQALLLVEDPGEEPTQRPWRLKRRGRRRGEG